MSMVVKNNLSALRILNVMNKNSFALAKSLTKVSSGQKINSAKDDSSAYSISEKMREMIRTLSQDSQNVQNGAALLKVADGGISSIVEELRNLKELAINAANDTNTDKDRATLQKVFTQKMANINDIATETNYNTKPLLDGTYAKAPPTSGGIFEPTNFIATITEGDYTITRDGVYELATGYTGTITVNAKNVKFTQEDSGDPAIVLDGVSIIGPSAGNANLWVENLRIRNEQDKNAIKFQGSDNFLSFKGINNSFAVMSDGTAGKDFFDSATINPGGGLTINGGDGAYLFVMNINGTRTCLQSDKFQKMR